MKQIHRRTPSHGIRMAVVQDAEGFLHPLNLCNSPPRDITAHLRAIEHISR